ncbi:hypothetical protein PUN28_011987 [Cardiocondyla obscurior]|uniref:Uncharacterized protein n=1 Tax=Cardiocondyla obscurior TaxID=286306 RepID=A0AAW2FDQ1_9HYME
MIGPRQRDAEARAYRRTERGFPEKNYNISCVHTADWNESPLRPDTLFDFRSGACHESTILLNVEDKDRDRVVTSILAIINGTQNDVTRHGGACHRETYEENSRGYVLASAFPSDRASGWRRAESWNRTVTRPGGDSAGDAEISMPGNGRSNASGIVKRPIEPISTTNWYFCRDKKTGDPLGVAVVFVIGAFAFGETRAPSDSVSLWWRRGASLVAVVRGEGDGWTGRACGTVEQDHLGTSRKNA